MSESANERIGDLVDDRYRLLALVGRGGMADVFRARDEQLGRVVALKLMRFEADIEAEDALRRHELEARIGAGISHPGLVTVFDVQAEGEHPYLVMEYVPGKTLNRVLVDGPMESTAVADMGAQLASALQAIHDAGVIHRDIKPSNVMLIEREPELPQIKLTDFGVSRYLEGTRLTSPDLLVGTARYLSPEQAVLDEVGPRADVYAMGLVLLEALTGEEAFPGSRIETLSARLHRQPRIPEELGPQWARMFDVMTRRRPESRVDAATASAALAALAAGGAVEPVLVAHGYPGAGEGEATVAGGAPADDADEDAPTVIGAAGAAAAGAAVGAGVAAGAGSAEAADGTEGGAETAADAETAEVPATADGAAGGSADGAAADGAAADGAATGAAGDEAAAEQTATDLAAVPSPWARRAPWIVVVLVVLAAGVAIAMIWTMREGDTPDPGPTAPTRTTPSSQPTDDPTATTTSQSTTAPTTRATTDDTTEPTTDATTDPTTAPTTTAPTTAPTTTAPTTAPTTTAPTTATTTAPPAPPTDEALPPTSTGTTPTP